MHDSKIEWTQSTWNPTRGCTRVSEGCRNCYAERIAGRFSKEGQPYHGTVTNTSDGSRWTGDILYPEHVLNQPLEWKKPRMIFVNSMSDLFHESIPFDYIKRIFEVMRSSHWHTFQVLTKRPQRMLEYQRNHGWVNNVWAGTSIENQEVLERVIWLRGMLMPRVRFLSIEPLLEPMPLLSLKNINWVIVGGESGPNARPIQKEWITHIRDKCLRKNVPFFFKQWGGVRKKIAGRELEGRTWDEMPELIERYETSPPQGGSINEHHPN